MLSETAFGNSRKFQSQLAKDVYIFNEERGPPPLIRKPTGDSPASFLMHSKKLIYQEI